MASSKIKDYISSLEEMRKDNRDRLHASALRWNELANTRSADLSRYLFAIASLVLPLSLLPLTNNDFLSSIAFESRIALIVGLILFVFSLIFGLIHLTKEAEFFNKWAEQENNRSRVFSEGILATSAQVAFDRLEIMNENSRRMVNMPSNPSNFFLYAQEMLLVLGILMIGVVLFFKLFQLQ